MIGTWFGPWSTLKQVPKKAWSKGNKALVRDTLDAGLQHVALNIYWSRSAAGVKINAVDKDPFYFFFRDVDARATHKLLVFLSGLPSSSLLGLEVRSMTVVIPATLVSLLC